MFSTVRFLVDTGAAMTCIRPKGSILPRLPFDRLKRGGCFAGVDGRSERFVERATLTFVDADGAVTHVNDMDVRVGKPEQVSRGLLSLSGLFSWSALAAYALQ